MTQEDTRRARGDKSRRIRTTKSSSYLEGDARGNKKKNKGEKEENLEPVGREPDVPDLRDEHYKK